MAAYPYDTAAQALRLLREKLSDWRDGPEPAWRSTWPVFERLIARHNEMVPVYEELARRKITSYLLWPLLERLVFAGALETPAHHEQLRADHRELESLYVRIRDASHLLAMMLAEAEEIENRNSFRTDRSVSLPELMAAAGEHNGHFRRYLKEEFGTLAHRYDLMFKWVVMLLNNYSLSIS